MKERISDVPINPSQKETSEFFPLIDIENPDDLRKLAKGALVEIVQTAPRNVALVGAIRELLDRIDGKAPQSLSMTVKTDPVATLSTTQLNALLALLPNPIIIPPMPEKLHIDNSNG